MNAKIEEAFEDELRKIGKVYVPPKIKKVGKVAPPKSEMFQMAGKAAPMMTMPLHPGMPSPPVSMTASATAPNIASRLMPKGARQKTRQWHAEGKIPKK